jgi:eukaryotic-like serine/threonine-protein kinase
MSSADQVPPLCNAYRFGPFEARVDEQILLHRGKRMKIQDLPFRMLLILLEHPGELVSKEILRDRLWGQETFIEVDKGLYVLAAKLREALRDNATVPRYIKTISGKGYRFVAKVDVLESKSTRSPQMSADDSRAKIERPPDTTSPASPGRIRRLPARFGSILVVAIFSGFLVYGGSSRPLIGVGDFVVAGGFANATGNPEFENILSSVFRLKLQESPYLSLIPDPQFRRFIHDPDFASSHDQVRACAALDGQVLLSGQLNSRPPGYRIQLMARRCRDGKLLATETADANSESSLLPALDQATAQLRRRLGESKKSVDDFNVPSMQATTNSIAALKAFSLGEEKRFQGLKQDALTDYKLAIDLDPQFAMAYARLGAVYTNMGEPSFNRQYYKRAFDLRSRTTDRERLYIITHYYASTTGEINRAIEDYELWRTLYPRDMAPANNLAVEYLILGTPEKSVELARSAVQLDPHDHFPYATLAQAYLETGDFANLHALCSDPAHNETDIAGFHAACFQGAFAQNDGLGMQQQMQWAKGKPEESRLTQEAADVAVYWGKLTEARGLFFAAKQNALRYSSPLAAAEIELDEATIDAELGLSREARKDALDALRLAPDKATEQAVAVVALARAGNVAAAWSNMTEAAAKAPSDTLLNSAVLALARAMIQLQRHKPKAAIQALEETRPFDFCDSASLAPPYVRGLAYLEDGDPKQAAKEFKKVLDHKQSLPTSLYIVLSQLELGHSLQLAGDLDAAARTFENLAHLWKDADPDFPPLKRLHHYQRNIVTRN